MYIQTKYCNKYCIYNVQVSFIMILYMVLFTTSNIVPSRISNNDMAKSIFNIICKKCDIMRY
jgi:hypothetical protein